jgi:hypothetical protein
MTEPLSTTHVLTMLGDLSHEAGAVQWAYAEFQEAVFTEHRALQLPAAPCVSTTVKRIAILLNAVIASRENLLAALERSMRHDELLPHVKSAEVQGWLSAAERKLRTCVVVSRNCYSACGDRAAAVKCLAGACMQFKLEEKENARLRLEADAAERNACPERAHDVFRDTILNTYLR